MAYTTADARQQLLDALAEAIDQIAVALASVGEAYEQLDEQNADKLEQELFRPVQMAYGRAKRTHAEFASRHRLPPQPFEPAVPGPPSQGVKGFLSSAVEAVGNADRAIATLQDSMLPIEVGDPELRAGLQDVRRLIAGLPEQARQLLRTLGR
jgi:hypothetical protein